jgi:hypothetical protein
MHTHIRKSELMGYTKPLIYCSQMYRFPGPIVQYLWSLNKCYLNYGPLKNGVFWDVTPCGFCKNRRFGGTQRLLHQDDKNQ